MKLEDEGQEVTKEEEKEESKEPINFLLDTGEIQAEDKSRTLAIYEEISEESASGVVSSLMYLHDTGKVEELVSEDSEETKISWEPIKMVVSSVGGSAHEMFAMYDTMRMVRKDCEIETIGLGKVMSAAILLLAAGTKGKRKIGMNCRVMLHPVAGGAIGDIEDIENDTKEIKTQQKQYVKCLAKETNMTVKKINSILKRKINHYFSAEEAVKYGIADEIL
jgi:ATP-dependent Clp endopeptidase proteolytic subunit ClpP